MTTTKKRYAKIEKHNPTKIRDELRCSGMINSSCYTSDTRLYLTFLYLSLIFVLAVVSSVVLRFQILLKRNVGPDWVLHKSVAELNEPMKCYKKMHYPLSEFKLYA
jgi:hypothetical protein